MKTSSVLKKTGVLTLLFFISHLSYSQKNYRGEFMIGIHGIYGKSKIDDIQTTIIPEPDFIGYSDSSKATKSFGGGIFINYRSKESPIFGGQVEGAFIRQGGKYMFQNTEKKWSYVMDFRYEYISANLLAKIYFGTYKSKKFWRGANCAFGLQVNTPITSKNIFFTHDGVGYEPAFGSDLEQQQQLRNVLKAKTNVGLIGSIGQEFVIEWGHVKVPMVIDFRGVQGVTDVIETYPNSYNFIENFNRNHVIWQFRVGFFLNTDSDDDE